MRPLRRRLLPLLGALIAASVALLAVLWPSDGSCPYLPSSVGGLSLPRSLSSLLPRLPYDMHSYWRSFTGASGLAPPPPRRRYSKSGERLFSSAELLEYDGRDPTAPLLLAIGGDVFDVTAKGSRFYAPGSGYAVFAGRDCSRALTLGSLDKADVARGDDVADFDAAQRSALFKQHAFYAEKYGPRVGKLRDARAPGSGPSAAAVLAAAAAEAAAEEAAGAAPEAEAEAEAAVPSSGAGDNAEAAATAAAADSKGNQR